MGIAAEAGCTVHQTAWGAVADNNTVGRLLDRPLVVVMVDSLADKVPAVVEVAAKVVVDRKAVVGSMVSAGDDCDYRVPSW